MRYIFLVFFACALLQGCSKKPHELRSPCVGAKGSPCDRVPVNKDLLDKFEA